MAFCAYDFKCIECDTVQDQIVTKTDDDPIAEDPCKKCQAAPEKLKSIIGVGAPYKHISWSKWKV